MRSYREEPAAQKPVPAPVVVPFRPRSELNRRRIPIEQTLKESDQFFRQADTSVWAHAEARHLVGLYWRFHETVHGIAPLELRDSAREWSAACVDAAMMLNRQFAGDRVAMAHFISWTWAREHDAVTRRRSTWRTTWRQQFGLKLLADYQASQARARIGATDYGTRR